MKNSLLLTAAAMLCACRPPVRYTYSDPLPPTHNEAMTVEPSKAIVEAPRPIDYTSADEPIYEEAPKIARQLAAVIAEPIVGWKMVTFLTTALRAVPTPSRHCGAMPGS